jgi:hypothetical protein
MPSDQYNIEWFGITRINKDGTWLTISPHYITVDQRVTDEPFSAEIKWQNNNEIGNTIDPINGTIYIGRTVEIYADTVTSVIPTMPLIFKGRVGNIGKLYDPNNESYVPVNYMELHGLGRKLIENNLDQGVASMSQKAQLIILANQALLKGLINNYNIVTVVPDVNLPQISGNRPYWDMIGEACKNADWDFNVDNGGTLWAYPRGYYTMPGSIVPDYQASFEWNADNLINTMDVWGQNTLVQGSDSSWSDSATLWGGTGYSITADWKKVGSYAMSAYATSAAEPWLDRSFPTTLDLSKGGNLHFWTRVNATGLVTAPGGFELEVRMTGASPTDYFRSTIAIPGGGFEKYVSMAFVKGYSAEAELIMGFNYNDPSGWEAVGIPSWDAITKIGWFLKTPLGATKSSLLIDNLYISDNYVVGKYGSIDPAYGTRQGVPIKDQNVSIEQANVLSSIVVSQYAIPRLHIENVRTDNIFNATIGNRATISLLGDPYVAEVRGLNWTFDGKKGDARLTLAQRELAKPEIIIKNALQLLERVGFDMDTWKRLVSTSAFIDTETGLIKWDKVDDLFGYNEWVSAVNMYPSTSEDAYNWQGGSMDDGGVVSWKTLSPGGYFKLNFGGNYPPWGLLYANVPNINFSGTVMGQFQYTNFTDNAQYYIGAGDYDHDYMGVRGMEHLPDGLNTLTFFCEGGNVNLGNVNASEPINIEWRWYGVGESAGHYYGTLIVYKDYIPMGTVYPASISTDLQYPIYFRSMSEYTTIEVHSYKISYGWNAV